MIHVREVISEKKGNDFWYCLFSIILLGYNVPSYNSMILFYLEHYINITNQSKKNTETNPYFG
jgi:hypothetical protein